MTSKRFCRSSTPVIMCLFIFLKLFFLCLRCLWLYRERKKNIGAVKVFRFLVYAFFLFYMLCSFFPTKVGSKKNNLNREFSIQFSPVFESVVDRLGLLNTVSFFELLFKIYWKEGKWCQEICLAIDVVLFHFHLNYFVIENIFY